jgi:competence ComEA-like helix-hairpin-helix protein
MSRFHSHHYYLSGIHSKEDLFVVGIVFCVVALLRFIRLHPTISTCIFVLVLIPTFFLRQFLMNWSYRRSISEVRKDLVKGPNIIENVNCTIKYHEKNNIVIMDNIPVNKKKRMMTVSKTGGVNVDKKWSDICRIYDTNTTLDTLIAFLDLDINNLVYLEVPSTTKAPVLPKQVNIDNTKTGAKLVNMDNVTPDSFGVDGSKSNVAPEKFVNLDNLDSAKPTQERQQQEPNFVEMGEVLTSSSQKINVNAVEAPELSMLPGINIVIAKKIIEYRNKNGQFKNVDEFIKASGVKEYFVPKIKAMITLEAENKPNDNGTDYEGRIVDF